MAEVQNESAPLDNGAVAPASSGEGRAASSGEGGAQTGAEGSPRRGKSRSGSRSATPHSRSPSPRAHRRNSPQRERERPQAAPTKTLFVRGVLPSVPDSEVIEVFKKEQGYVELRRIRNNVIFVDYDTVENATSALKSLQGFKFQGAYRGIHIDFDRKKNTGDRKRKFSDTHSPRDNRERNDEPQNNKRKRSTSPDAHSPRKQSPDYDKRSESPDRRSSPHRRNTRRTSRHSPRRSSRRSSTPQRSPSHDRYHERSRSRERGGRGRGGDQAYPRSSNSSMRHSHHSPNQTLFVSNLPSEVTEKELSMVFRAALGRHRHLFKDVRVIPKDKNRPIAFVDFEDSRIAEHAMDSLQGFRLDPKSSNPMQIEFDRKSGSSSRR